MQLVLPDLYLFVMCTRCARPLNVVGLLCCASWPVYGVGKHWKFTSDDLSVTFVCKHGVLVADVVSIRSKARGREHAWSVDGRTGLDAHTKKKGRGKEK